MDRVPYELLSLAKATRYQQWLRDLVMPFMGQSTLELGSGIGNMSQWLPKRECLVLTDNDPDLIAHLTEKMAHWNNRDSSCNVYVRRLDIENDDLEQFKPHRIDTVVSFNVLEHVQDDRKVMRNLRHLLDGNNRPGKKRIVTFVPAHNWAFGSLDVKFGHHRRYDRKMMASLAKETVPNANVRCEYVNLPGLIGWYMTGRVFKKSEIGDAAIQIFELLCPLIRPIDKTLHRLFRLPLGQSLLSVWEWE